MLTEISESNFLKKATVPIKQIEICDLFWLMDDDLLDCGGIVVSFGDDKILIESKAVNEEYDFVYYEYSPTDRDILSQKIISTEDEAIEFIRIERGESDPVLRFHIGSRPILVTADSDSLTVGLSHWDINGEWIEYENNALLNG